MVGEFPCQTYINVWTNQTTVWTAKLTFGEANDVDTHFVNDWRVNIERLIVDYELENITKCDETYLFSFALPNKTLELKRESAGNGGRRG